MELIFLIAGAIVVSRLFAVGARTAAASEASAVALVTLVAALTPEARARAAAALERIVEGDRT
jgi:hypothetical protein